MKYLVQLSLLLLSFISTAQIPTDSLLLYYPFNGNANDASINSLHGTVNGATLVNDRFGNPNSAYYFDGNNDYIDLPNVSLLKPNFPISFSFWAKLESLAQLDNQFFSTSPVNGNYAGCTFNTTSAGNGGLNINYGDNLGGANSNHRRSKTVASNFTTNTWYHIVGIFRGPLDMDVYINGTLISSGFYTGSGGPLAYANVSGSIGRANLSNFYHWGTIDDFAIYNKSLTPCEVQQLYSENSTETTDTYTVCDSLTWIDGNVYYSDNTTATHTLTSTLGCDSNILLNLDVIEIDTTLSQIGNQLIAVSQTNATYQWVHCNATLDEVVGQTSPLFTPTTSGNYAVIIEIDGCQMQSNCMSIKTDTLSIKKPFSPHLLLTPNPVVSQLTLNFKQELSSVQLKLISALGREVSTFNYTNSSQVSLSVKHLPAGLYYISIHSNQQYTSHKFIKL